MERTGLTISTVTGEAGYAYTPKSSRIERRGIDALIPTKAEPIHSPAVSFRYDAKHAILKCAGSRSGLQRPHAAALPCRFRITSPIAASSLGGRDRRTRPARRL